MSMLIAAETLELAPVPSGIGSAVHWVLEHTPRSFSRSRIDIGLTEALTNAMLHGVLELDLPEDREPSVVLDLIAERARHPGFAGRRIQIDLGYTEEELHVNLSWIGAPYRPCLLDPDEDQDYPAISGRGVRLIEWCFDRVEWGADGLSVKLVLPSED